MLIRNITYKTFEVPPQTVTEPFAFNISQPELLKYVSDPENNLAGKVHALTEARTIRQVILLIEDIIMMAYGVRSEDGKKFMKDEEIRKDFYQSGAYPVLYMELAKSEEKTADFIKKILPEEMDGDIQKAFSEAKKQADAQKELMSQTDPAPATTP